MLAEDTGGDTISAWSALFAENVLDMDQYVFRLVDPTGTWAPSVDVVLEILAVRNVELVELVLERREA